MGNPPEHFKKLQAQYGAVFDRLKDLGDAIQDSGPVDRKTGHLIQLAAAATLRSEGAVHSHTRRALKAGVSADEIRHALLLLIPTIGFPTVSAALSWAADVIDA